MFVCVYLHESKAKGVLLSRLVPVTVMLAAQC